MRAMLCHCRLHLEARSDSALLRLLRDHVIRAHPSVSPTDEQLRGIISARAYELELRRGSLVGSVSVREPARQTRRGLGGRRGSAARLGWYSRLPSYGARVRVREHHAIEWRRGLEGTVVGCYGGDEYVALEVLLFAGRERRMFWARDLEEVTEGASAEGVDEHRPGSLIR